MLSPGFFGTVVAIISSPANLGSNPLPSYLPSGRCSHQRTLAPPLVLVLDTPLDSVSVSTLAMNHTFRWWILAPATLHLFLFDFWDSLPRYTHILLGYWHYCLEIPILIGYWHSCPHWILAILPTLLILLGFRHSCRLNKSSLDTGNLALI